MGLGLAEIATAGGRGSAESLSVTRRPAFRHTLVQQERVSEIEPDPLSHGTSLSDWLDQSVNPADAERPAFRSFLTAMSE